MNGRFYVDKPQAPRIIIECPICGNADGAADIKPRPEPNEWGNRFWIKCRKCEGSMAGEDYLPLVAEALETTPVELLRDAENILAKAGYLDSTPGQNNHRAKTNRLDGDSSLELSHRVRPVDLCLRDWGGWHRKLLADDRMHGLLGGRKVVAKHRLMALPPGAFGERLRISPAIGFPVRDMGRPVNVIRRFLDQIDPRYKGLLGRSTRYLWPDRRLLPRKGNVVLVAGMRDACFARAARIPAWTTTGGVGNWPEVGDWAAGREFTLCFDAKEQGAAGRLAARLVESGARRACLIPPPQGYKDIAELGEREGLAAIQDLLQGVT